MLFENQRRKVMATALEAREMGLVTLTFGNFSLRDESSGLVCITPSGMDYRELTPEDIVVVDLDGRVVEGGRRPSTETPLHCLAYKKRGDVFGICHTHSVFATAWASCGLAIPAIVFELAALIGGPVECAPYRRAGTAELAEAAVEALRDRQAVLLANHGLLAVGPDLGAALVNAAVVEEGAKIACLARGIGELRPIPEEECRAARRQFLQKYGQR